MQSPSILVDTSVLIQFVRKDKRIVDAMQPLMISRSLAICGMIRQELLQGARNEPAFRSLQILIADLIQIDELPEDFNSAAKLYMRLRNSGITPSSQDCLIAAVAIRAGMKLWTMDGLLKKAPGLNLFEP